ncbi:hypothetical protein PsYK624_171650 [Phanerochaete sordida]|uniref:Uncharacterized protein n=1 Tax=Phanerochaete sordida TaxID=48140 RepID=A0A9P3GS36_9APHY|nr:hypothetical protein PsYK624_171650 [Phanerochaete sordida]
MVHYAAQQLLQRDASHMPQRVVRPNENPEIAGAGESEGRDGNQETEETEDVGGDTPGGFSPFPNKSSFELGKWFYNGKPLKSMKELLKLVKLLVAGKVVPSDLEDVNFSRIHNDLASGRRTTGDTQNGAKTSDRRTDRADQRDPKDQAAAASKMHEEPPADGRTSDADWETEEVDEGLPLGWKRTPVTIPVPCKQACVDPGTRDYTVEPGFLHRSLVDVIKTSIEDPDRFANFHTEPYESWFQPDEANDPIRVYGELYTSDAFIAEQQKVQEINPKEEMEHVVVGLMFASDSTQLSQFGDNALWPLYLAYGNESKYLRTKPREKLAEIVAFFEHLPAGFRQYATDRYGKAPDEFFMSHCEREYFHGQWKILLDEEFIRAYQEGIVINCGDGAQRRFFPRIFTYSADYKEKIQVANLRNMGISPCTRCMITKDKLHRLGQMLDTKMRTSCARRHDGPFMFSIRRAIQLIREGNLGVDTTKLDASLKERSLLPIENAFDCLAELDMGFDIFQILVPDLLHEMELGVWKALFIHLLRILDCIDGTLKSEVAYRLRQVPSFGDAIRRISGDRTLLKRITAHEYEDMLQIAVPVFDGLFANERDNQLVSKLLFELAHWHSLAKLRMHTDSTLELLDDATRTGAVGPSLKHQQVGDPTRTNVLAPGLSLGVVCNVSDAPPGLLPYLEPVAGSNSAIKVLDGVGSRPRCSLARYFAGNCRSTSQPQVFPIWK